MEEDQFPLAMLVAPQNGWPTNTVDGQALRCHTVGAFGRGAPYGLSQIQWDKPTVHFGQHAQPSTGWEKTTCENLVNLSTKEEIMIDHSAKFIEIEWKLGSKTQITWKCAPKPSSTRFVFLRFLLQNGRWRSRFDKWINGRLVVWLIGILITIYIPYQPNHCLIWLIIHGLI